MIPNEVAQRPNQMRDLANPLNQEQPVQNAENLVVLAALGGEG